MSLCGKCAGWAPQTFTSSRKNRAEVKEQSVYSFLDDDEKAVWSILVAFLAPNYYFYQLLNISK